MRTSPPPHAARATRHARDHEVACGDRGEDAHELHDGHGLVGGLAGDLEQVDGYDLERIVHALDLIAVERDRLATLEHALRSKLSEIAAAARHPVPLLTLKEVTRQLCVSRDWVHDHAEEEGLAVHLGGNVTRYDPEAVARLRTRRRRREPPRD